MLTERQQAVLDFIRTFQMAKGVPPSTREIQRHFGFASQTAVMGHLRALANKGMIEQLAGRVWGLRAREVQAHLFEVSVYGTIPAGLPAMNEEQADETVAVDPAAFGLRQFSRIFGLHVRGDSMSGAHIVDGDIVLLAPRPARPGDIVAALVDGETTLKRLVTVRGRPVLRPENPRYRDIVPQEHVEIQGVMVGVIGRGRR
jgi:repressor LexA